MRDLLYEVISKIICFIPQFITAVLAIEMQDKCQEASTMLLVIAWCKKFEEIRETLRVNT